VEEQPYNTQETLCLMQALEAASDRAGALEQAERHTALMHDQLAAAPSPDVLSYAERLRKEPVGHEGDVSLGTAEAAASSSAGGGTAAGVTWPSALRRRHPMRLAALFGIGAVAVLAVLYWLMRRLGLPGWVFGAAVALVIVVLSITLATALVGQQLATTRMTTPPVGVRSVAHRRLR